MAPSLKRTMKTAKSSNKKMKFTKTIPEDLVEHILSKFLPIQWFLRNRVLSKRFVNTEIQSYNLDFSGIYSKRRRQLHVVDIIEKVFNQHKGSEIHRLVLIINHLRVEDKVISWVNTCLDKKIKEIVLDFSKSKRVMQIPIDFSAVETIQVLKLRWCKFEIPNNSPKGLRLLKNLSLMRTEVAKETINAIFSNCIHLESLELIECRMNGVLNIYAHNHKKFKSLVVSSMRNLGFILLDAPTLENYKYDGYVTRVNFRITNALKDANLHYNRNCTRSLDNPSELVVANMIFYTKVSVLATTTIFLEALTERYNTKSGRLEKLPFKFVNLTEFKIFFKTPTFCTLYDIAEFLKECPKLEKVVIDVQNFTFELPLRFWEIHHKEQIQNNKYRMEFLTDVKIIGYKGHWHELDIVEFFAKNAPSLKSLELGMPKNTNNNVHAPDYICENKFHKTHICRGCSHRSLNSGCA